MRWTNGKKPKDGDIRILKKFAWLPRKNVIGNNGDKFTVWMELYERVERWHVPSLLLQFTPPPYWEHVQDQTIPYQRGLQ